MAIVKKARKVHPDEPGLGYSKTRGRTHSSGHHMLAHLKRANHLEVVVLKVREDLQAEINHLQTMAVEAEHLAGEKMMESESLHGILQKEEFISTGLKVVLTLEEEEKKEARLKIVKLEA
ncbi:hypothetical protein COCNU_scaffold004569G000010 [Cocos nucifera]|nr:hypothetical protein [Cocos nucifera]